MNKLVVAAFAVIVMSQSSSFGGFVGVNYGPFHRDGQGPKSRIEDEQFHKDLSTIWNAGYRYIRTYEVGGTSRMDKLVPYIHQHFPGMKVYLGVWEVPEDRHSEATKRDPDSTLNQLIKAVELAKHHSDIVEYIVVGNESLVGIDQLISDIQWVKREIPAHIKVTSCFTYGEAMNNGPRLLNESGADSLMFNVYPFFVSIPIEQAKENTITYGYKAGQTKSGGKPVILGEVGWPSAGPAWGGAVASVANQKRYVADVTAAANSGELGSIFIFEAFDEPWKTGNAAEPHFGIWNSDGSPK